MKTTDDRPTLDGLAAKITEWQHLLEGCKVYLLLKSEPRCMRLLGKTFLDIRETLAALELYDLGVFPLAKLGEE